MATAATNKRLSADTCGVAISSDGRGRSLRSRSKDQMPAHSWIGRCWTPVGCALLHLDGQRTLVESVNALPGTTTLSASGACFDCPTFHVYGRFRYRLLGQTVSHGFGENWRGFEPCVELV